MKEWYLSKTPFLTFVYISKCNINLPGYFGNSKKRFLWTGLVIIHVNKWWSDTPLSVSKYKCLDLLVYALTYAVRKRHAHDAHICINRIYQYADYAHIENIFTDWKYMRICGKPQPHMCISAWNRMATSNIDISDIIEEINYTMAQYQ